MANEEILEILDEIVYKLEYLTPSIEHDVDNLDDIASAKDLIESVACKLEEDE